jgi:signal transduction histidine kinase/DNA-binding response OmpR family regulator/HPt (histidine-containing phosphotransfer) domain-containing protein
MRRIKARVFFPLVGVFALLAVSQYLYFPAQQRQALGESLRQKAVAITELAAYDVRPGIEFEDPELVNTVFRGAARDDDLLFIAARSDPESLFASLNPGELDPGTLPAGPPPETTVSRRPGQLWVQTPVELGVGPGASVTAAFSTSRIDAEAARHEQVAMLIGGVLFAIGLFVALWISMAMRRNELLAIEAQAASRAKSDFLANMSHEIRTPMNAVFGMTDMLLASPLGQRERGFAEQVRESSEHLLAIIDDILDFSKIEAGRLELEIIEFDLVRRVEETVESFARDAQAKGIELMCHVHPSVPQVVEGDPLRFSQVLSNLVSNAVKFTQSGEITVRARLAATDGQDLTIRIEVKDSGIGITSEQKERLFQAFVQADTSTTRRFGGTGLGLVISRQLTELMGGELDVDSKPGKGSTFWFTIRAKAVREPTAQIRRASRKLEGLRVLVVDDNATNRLIVCEAMRAWGMVPVEADTPSRALVLLTEARDAGEPFELAIVDFHMPEMDGIELARRMHAKEESPELPIVMLTSVVSDAPKQDLESAGVDACLDKPVRRSKLLESLERVVGAATPAAVPPPSDAARRLPAPELPEDARTVLVAEDSEMNQRVMIAMLERMGFRAHVVGNGRLAVDARVGDPARFAALLMDCQMPEMDGYEATRFIRTKEVEGGLGRIPIIAVTAHAMRGDRDRVIAVGMDDYVTKPVRFEVLEGTLTRWCDGGGRNGSDRPATIVARPSGLLDETIVAQLRSLESHTRPGFLKEVVESFRKDADQLVADMRAALEAGDLEGLRRAGHTLKGTSRNVGAMDLAMAAERVQSGADLEGASDLVGAVEREIARVRPALEALVSLEATGREGGE